MKAVVWGAAALFVLAAALPARGVEPRIWRTTGVAGWSAADRESVGVTSRGSAVLGLGTVPASPLDAVLVWDLLPDGRNVLAATGENGTLYRIARGGEATAVTRVEQPEITALGRDGSGRILLGASPDGILYRLEGDEAVQIADLPESYIWRILPAGRDGAVIATGDPGRIYRLDGRGTATLLADVSASHVTGLAPSGSGFVATTDSPGRLLSVDAGGSWKVLYDGEDAELRAPVVAEGGMLYFARNPEGKNESGTVHRVLPSGAVEPVWDALEGYVYALAPAGKSALWVATGGEDKKGSLVRLDPSPPSSWVEVVQVEEPQILSLAVGDGESGWFGTAGVGRVYRILSEGAVTGTVTSEVQDAGDAARWGTVRLLTTSGFGGGRASTRSGNTRVPDDTWSSWTRVRLDGEQGPVASPSARFLQWKLEIDRAGTEVQDVRVFYLPANRPPRVNEVEVTELGGDLSVSWDRGQPSSLLQELPGGVRAEFQVPSSRSSVTPAGDDAAAWARRYRTFTWKADDPNDDDLTFELDLRPAAAGDWNPIQKEVESSPWVWDSSTVPDGWYVLRVSASDAPSNPPHEELTANRATDPFLVDNTPPEIRELRSGGNGVQGTARDATSAVKRLDFSVDGGEWQVLFPDDGIPDSRTETFTVPTSSLEPGRHVIVIRAFDLAGNPGTGRIDVDRP